MEKNDLKEGIEALNEVPRTDALEADEHAGTKEDLKNKIDEVFYKKTKEQEDIFVEQLKYQTVEDLEAAAKESDEEYDASDEGQRSQKFRAVRDWVGKFLRSTYLSGRLIGTIGTAVTATNAHATENTTIDPESLKNQMGISVDTEKKIEPDDTYISKPSEFTGGGDPDHDDLEKTIQQKHDAEVAARHEREWNQDDSHFVKNGEELKSVIRHSLSELGDNFEDERDLRNGIDKLYSEVLTPLEIANLVSYIINGAPVNSEGVIEEANVEELQTIATKIDSALKNILDENGGIDAKFGIKTDEALGSLDDNLTAKLSGKDFSEDVVEKLHHIVEIAGVENGDLDTEKTEVALGEMEIKEAPKQYGETTIGLVFETPQYFERYEDMSASIKIFESSTDVIGKIGDNLQNTSTSDLDKINLKGEGYDGTPCDFGELGNIKPASERGNGLYEFDGKEGFGGSFVYEVRDHETDYMRMKDMHFTHENNGTEMSVNIGKLEKFGHDNNFLFQLDDIKLEFPSVEGQEEPDFVSAKQFLKSQDGEDISVFTKDFNVKFGGDNHFHVDYLKANVNENIFDHAKSILHGENGLKPGDLFNKFIDVGLGTMSFTNEKAGVDIMIKDNKLLFNDNLITRGEGGKIIVEDRAGNGFEYNGGSSSRIVIDQIDGKPAIETTAGKLIDDLLLNGDGGKSLRESPGAHAEFSAFGGVFNIKFDAKMEITDETLAESRVLLDKSFQTAADKIEDVVKSLEGGNTANLLGKAVELKGDLVEVFVNLGDDLLKTNSVVFEKAEFTLNMHDFAKNLKGKGDQEDFMRAIGQAGENLMKGGQITINKAFIEEYKAADNSGDFAAQKLGWGDSMEDAIKNPLKDMESEVAHKVLGSSSENFVSVMKMDKDEVNTFYIKQNENGGKSIVGIVDLYQTLNPDRKLDIYVNAHVEMDGKTEQSTVKLINPNHNNEYGIGASIGTKNVGSAGVIFDYEVVDKKGTTLEAAIGFGATGFKVENADIALVTGPTSSAETPAYKLVEIGDMAKIVDELKITDLDKQIEVIDKYVGSGKLLFAPFIQVGGNFTQKLGHGAEVHANLATTIVPIPGYPAITSEIGVGGTKTFGELGDLKIGADVKYDFHGKPGVNFSAAIPINSIGKLFK